MIEYLREDEVVIAVGSENRAKIKAAELVMAKIFKTFRVIPAKVTSGVSAQPMSDEESIKGATNRARMALEATDADYGLGMEGGLSRVGDQWFECGWMAVIDKKGVVGIGSSGRFEMPAQFMPMIESGMELGDVMDKVTGLSGVRSDQGAMGILTRGHVPRDVAYSHGILFAFARFLSEPTYWQ